MGLAAREAFRTFILKPGYNRTLLISDESVAKARRCCVFSDPICKHETASYKPRDLLLGGDRMWILVRLVICCLDLVINWLGALCLQGREVPQ